MDHSTNIYFDVQSVNDWFCTSKRSFPWRLNPTPYRVLVSEIMLQQTQASVVESYFIRWMKVLPTLHALARASFQQVLQLWEGLGYYRRARYLHLAAQKLIGNGAEDLPMTKKELLAIPGIGQYTAGAILSFAFHQKAPAIDGNVARVLCRYFSIEKELSASMIAKYLYPLLDSILPDKSPWVFMEGLIELGATVCSKVPKCSICPLFHSCAARQSQRAEKLPKKRKKEPSIHIKREVAIVLCHENILVRRAGSDEVMAGLLQLPYCEEKGSIAEFLLQKLKLPIVFVRSLPQVVHSFTRYKATLFPSIFHASFLAEIPGYFWIPLSDRKDYAFCSGHRQILTSLQQSEAT